MSFGTLALIGLCGLCGPILSYVSRGVVPVVVGEIAAGVIVGHTGLRAIDPTDPGLSFLGAIGFAMLMLSAGMNVPLRDARIASSLARGARAAGVVAILALGGGFLVASIGGAGHPFVYTVLIASGSAAIVLPVIQDRRIITAAMISLGVCSAGAALIASRPARPADR